MGPCGAFLSTKASLRPPPFVGLPWEKKGFPWWKKSFSLLGLPWVPKNRLSPQMLPLNTLPWQPSGSSGLLSPSYPFMLAVCNKCCTFLYYHSIVSVDWLCCAVGKWTQVHSNNTCDNSSSCLGTISSWTGPGTLSSCSWLISYLLWQEKGKNAIITHITMTGTCLHWNNICLSTFPVPVLSR